MLKKSLPVGGVAIKFSFNESCKYFFVLIEQVINVVLVDDAYRLSADTNYI